MSCINRLFFSYVCFIFMISKFGPMFVCLLVCNVNVVWSEKSSCHFRCGVSARKCDDTLLMKSKLLIRLFLTVNPPTTSLSKSTRDNNHRRFMATEFLQPKTRWTNTVKYKGVLLQNHIFSINMLIFSVVTEPLTGFDLRQRLCKLRTNFNT